MKKLLILVLLSVLFMPMNGSAKADEVLYCQSELATGFKPDHFDFPKWKTDNFKLKRFTVKVHGDFDSVSGLWYTIRFPCHNPYSTSSEEYICRKDDGGAFQFFYSKSTKRFVYSELGTLGYIKPHLKNEDIIYAGTCEKF